MQVHQINLTKKKLAAMPESQRTILLLLGHASNEISVLSKLILMTRRTPPPVQLMDHVESGVTFIILRLLIGKLHEAWLLFTSRVNSDSVTRAKYLANLNSEAADALTELKKYFGAGSSSMPNIRNKFSFHYTDKDNLIETNFKRIPESEPWVFYICNMVANTFYFASELVVSGGVVDLAKKSEPRDGVSALQSEEAQSFESLCNSVNRSVGHITTLFGEIMGMIVEDSIGLDVEQTIVNIPDGPKLSEFPLPFFFDENDLFGPSSPKA